MQDQLRVATDRALAFETAYEQNLDGLSDNLEASLLLLLLGGNVDRASVVALFSEFAGRLDSVFTDSLLEVARFYTDELNRQIPDASLGAVDASYVESIVVDGYSASDWLDKLSERNLSAILLIMLAGDNGSNLDAAIAKLKADINLAFTSFTSEIMRERVKDIGRRFEKPDAGFIYWHLNSGSGICPECAPYLGVFTTGTDGRTPVPPLHLRCRCYLAPTGMAVPDKPDASLRRDHYEWMSGLSRNKLEKIVGKKRARLVFDEGVPVSDLYDGDFNLR